ncbi:MAG: flagellar biosynthesis anti-sigma factor FlgM [Gammaproteobacteria bacterium]|nr:flagellar biosynthesis anti-sigma factor FlgM [Gammaproteobacteria bacterium]
MVAEVNGAHSAAIHSLTSSASDGAAAARGNTGAGGTAQGGAGAVSLTDTASGMLELERAVAAAPTVDQDKVARLREAISDGSYVIDYEQTATRLMQFEAAHPDRG